MKKVCNKCKECKSLDEFHNKKSGKDGKQTFCKSCNNSIVKQWQAANPDKFEANWKRNSYGDVSLLKRRASRYGLSVEELQAMLDAADNKCNICHREPVKWLVVDHCHNSLKVRGIICERCNTALGLFADNIEFLQNAIQYLNEGR